jgi:hypothetical protein
MSVARYLVVAFVDVKRMALLVELSLAVPHDVDVINPEELEARVLVDVLSLVAGSLGLVGHGVGLWSRVKHEQGL